MSTRITVPFYTPAPEDRETVLGLLRQSGAYRILLVPPRELLTETGESRAEMLRQLGENVAYFRKNGLDVGVWINSFGFGIPFLPAMAEPMRGVTRIRSVTGREADYAICPEDPRFMEYFTRQIRDLAALEPDLILLDDDLCLSVRPGLGCFCERHRKLLADRLGEAIPPEELPARIFSGRNLRERHAWAEVMGDSLRRFCAAVRAAADEVNPNVRIGNCAGYSSFHLEGVDALELSRILAGKSRPFLRTSGSPYWAVPDIRRFRRYDLNTYLEFVRRQEFFCRGTDVELLHEDDSYPRPCYTVPSSYIECFDLALRASGGLDALKYLFEYRNPTYEDGYLRAQQRHRPLYDFIEKHFTGKSDVGIQVREDLDKFYDAELPSPMPTERELMHSNCFSAGASLLTAHGIPVTYGEAECEILFGENARNAPIRKKKYVIDLPAAKLLRERGIDTGILSEVSAPIPGFEWIAGAPFHNNFNGFGNFYDCTLAPGAEVVSEFKYADHRIPAVVRYSGKDAEFLIYTFSTWDIDTCSGFMHAYERQRQLLEFFGSDYTLPYIERAPGTYAVCRQGNGELAILYANLWCEEIADFDIHTGKTYRSVELCGAQGTLSGNTLHISSAFTPYSCFAVLLKE